MDINKIKDEYTNKINRKLKKYCDIILESFIEFYGEKYRKIITDRFNDISFLYYISDLTIFYIVDSLKDGYNDKFKKIFFAIPYISYLIENNFYKQCITKHNFYELGINKIVGSSNSELLSDEELIKYSIAIALRENNIEPYEVNLPFEQNIKRIVALPIFSINDKLLFHELNHAICSECVTKNGKKIIKCGLDYSSNENNYSYEIINDLAALEIYNIFKSKCSDTILDDNIMDEVLFDVYSNYYDLIIDFYEKNKERIKSSLIDDKSFQMQENELELLDNVVKQNQKNK